MKKKNADAGFTIAEMAVVLGCVALLAAITVPVVGKMINEARIAAAKNQCNVLAAAVAKFVQDVAYGSRGAMSNCASYCMPQNLTTGTLVTPNEDSNGTDYGYTQDDNDGWYDGGRPDRGCQMVQTFYSYLISNVNDCDGTSPMYPTTGRIAWKGPYISASACGDDPWGRHYVCNINGTWFNADNVQAVVMSAGPNGYFDTAYSPVASTTQPSGDDIWVIVNIAAD